MLVVEVVDQTYLEEVVLVVLVAVVMEQLDPLVMPILPPIPLVAVAAAVGIMVTLPVDLVDQVSWSFVM